MARNKIVPGPRDHAYGEGPNINSNNIRPFKKAKKKEPTKRSTLTASAANNIRRFKDSDHETYYTGGFRLGDDGKLIPVMGIEKKQAKANNIRRLKDSGHQLVIDDDDPKRLKIIKQFRPRA